MSIVIKNSQGGRSAGRARPVNSKNTMRKKSAKTKKPRQRRGRQRVANRAELNLAPCTIRYAQATINPFSYMDNELPCIPDDQDVPTFKGSVLGYGTFAAGSTGFGFVGVAPFTTGLSDGQAVAHTTASYALSSVNATFGTTGISTHNLVRAPFAASAMPLGRLVALGLRIRYIDTELNRGGRVGVASSSDIHIGDDPLQGVTSDGLFSRPNSQSKQVDRRWHTVAFRPSDAHFGRWQPGSGLGPSGDPSNLKLIAFVECSPSLKFEYAIIAYWEFKPDGPRGVPSTTKSHVDPYGFAVVRDFLAQAQDSEVGTAAWQAFLAYSKKAVMSYIGVPTTAALGWR